MSLKSKMLIFLGVVSIITLISTIYRSANQPIAQSNIDSVTDKQSVNKVIEESASSDSRPTPSRKLERDTPAEPTKAQMVTNVLQLNLHRDEQEENYKDMSLDDLKAAAESGDRYYQFALAEKLSKNILELGVANAWYRKAATQGSVNALLRLQSNRLRQAVYVGGINSAKGKKYVMEALAWAQVTERRGFSQSVAFGASDNRLDYLQYLNEQEKKQARKMGNFYYERLVNERMKQGLGSFEALAPNTASN